MTAFRLDSRPPTKHFEGRLRGNDASGPIIKGRVKVLEILVCRMDQKFLPCRISCDRLP